MKAKIRFLLKIAVSLTILWLCFARIEFSRFSLELSNINPWYLALAFVLNIIASIVIPACVSGVALRANRLDLSLLDLVKINFSIRFYTIIFPRGVATGIRWAKYKGAGTGQNALTLVLFEKVIQILILMLTATVFLWFDMEKLPANSGYIFAVASMGLVVSLVCTLLFFSKSFSSIFLHIVKLNGRFVPMFVRDKLGRFWEAVCAFQNLSYSSIFSIIGLSLLSYVFFILSPYVLTFAMDIDISLMGIAWIRSLVLILALIPVTVAGLGLREAGYVSFMQLYGILNHEALAFSIALFFIQIMIGVIGALLELWNHFVLPLYNKTQAVQSVEQETGKQARLTNPEDRV